MAKKGRRDELIEYRKRRDFGRTSEPEGGGATGREGLRFVIQKHDATRLHYDLRLELDGVLKSWAVPKGPSLDPSEKRLAVQTEDHPLSYGDFEDVIPPGAYGAGPVIVWDQGIWTPDGDPHEGLAAGKLEFQLYGEKLSGGWRLVRTRAEGRKASWLWMKREDASAARNSGVALVDAMPRSVRSGRTIREVQRGVEPRELPDLSGEPGARRAAMPARIAAQLATPVSRPPRGTWLSEIKLDGYRLMLRKDGARLGLVSRGGRDWTHRFPSVIRALAELPARQVILDGEVVLLDGQGRSDFGALQAANRRPDAPFICFAFDLLYLNGYDLREVPLRRRKALLQPLLGESRGRALRFTEHIEGPTGAFYREACRLGLEGMVCKRGEAPYRSGRGRSWLKLRCRERAELVVVGFTEPRGDRPGFGALLVAVPEGGSLRYAGKVGSGFSERVLRDLSGRLRGMAVKGPSAEGAPETAGVTWVEPNLRVQVAFSEWTRDRKVRHGVFEGLVEASGERGAQRKARRVAPGTAWVAGVKLTHADRVLFAEAGITKQELAETYEALEDRIMPPLRGRPLTLYRCPEGAGSACFFQKHHRAGVPDNVGRIPSEEGEDLMEIADLAGLIGLVQIGTLELHIPIVCTDSPDRPDRLVMDLDPGPGVVWGQLVQAAQRLRVHFEEMGWVPFVRTTGGAGLHVVVPLLPEADLESVRGIAKEIATQFARREPSKYTAKLAKSARKDRIFIDWVRNTRGATAISSWSTRARPSAPIAAPLSWDELDPSAEGPPGIGLRDALRRPDPWAGFEAARRGWGR